MPEHPILLFPDRKVAPREVSKGFPVTPPHIPSTRRQSRRIGPKLDELHRVFNAQRAEVSADAMGAAPEHVIVLETIGAIDNFLSACNNIPGLEWLADVDETEIEPDEDFYDEKKKDKQLRGRLFLTMANQKAMETMLSLWGKYNKDPNADLGYGRNSWKNIFKFLYDVRRWGIQDRIKETHFLENFQFRIEHDESNLPFEIELWFRGDSGKRKEVEKSIAELVEEEGGTVHRASVIEEIRYHAILADVPVDSAKRILSNLEDIQLIKCDQVMFFRPVGQSVSVSPISESTPSYTLEKAPLPSGKEPIVALLDGLPLMGHKGLDGRIMLDDPDELGRRYNPSDCKHGTSMASLILHDEISEPGAPSNRLLYVRPIMEPKPNHLKGGTVECIPDSILLTDLIHIAVKRLFDGVGDEEPIAPSVRIINLSIGDPSRPFLRYLSSTARLLDWLSHEYNVLFCVSAGNHPNDIDIASGSSLTVEELEKETIKSIHGDLRNRRLLSPAESINSLTVGALHDDLSGDYPDDRRVDLLSQTGLASPMSACGLGFNRSVKPDVMFPGGRQLYLEPMVGDSYKLAEIDKAPGQLVACPGASLDHATYTRGTSNATALASRSAEQCYNLLEELAELYGVTDIEDKHIPPLLKAMIVHGAKWDGDAIRILNTLKNKNNSRIFKSLISQHLGYGAAHIDRVLACTEERATVLGYSELKGNEAHIYELPLPSGLSGTTLWRALVITLAWTSPINVNHRKYRKAKLTFTPPLKDVGVKRTEADWRAVQRGTVQHERMSGKKALDFLDGDTIKIRIDCTADAASSLPESIPYALAVTFEMGEGAPVAVYQEIKQRLGVAVAVQPRA